MGSDLSTVHGVPGQWYQVPGQAATRGHAGASAAEIHQTNSTYFSLPLDIFNLPISSLGAKQWNLRIVGPHRQGGKVFFKLGGEGEAFFKVDGGGKSLFFKAKFSTYAKMNATRHTCNTLAASSLVPPEL